MVKIKQVNRMIIVILVGAVITSLIGVSCTNGGSGNTKEARIPIPADTSSLAKIDHFISMDQMDEFKRDFLPQRDSIGLKNPNLFIPTDEAFNKTSLIDILKDPECVGIKIYYGLKKGKRNEFRLMLVGVNSQGKDLYINKTSSVTAAKIAGNGQGGLEFGQCPPCEK